MNGLCSDPGALALDYRGIGFRECVAEVARYLAAAEGLDFNDPLRLRLLGHLEAAAFNSQREAIHSQRDVIYSQRDAIHSQFNSQATKLGSANFHQTGSGTATAAAWNAWSASLQHHPHNNGVSSAMATHSKLSSYAAGLSATKPGSHLNPIGLTGTAQTPGGNPHHLDSAAYLAASRLGSTIGLAAAVTSSNLTQLPPPPPQTGSTGSTHYSVTQGVVGNKLSQYGHGNIKHIGDIKHLGSEFAY